MRRPFSVVLDVEQLEERLACSVSLLPDGVGYAGPARLDRYDPVAVVRFLEQPLYTPDLGAGTGHVNGRTAVDVRPRDEVFAFAPVGFSQAAGAGPAFLNSSRETSGIDGGTFDPRPGTSLLVRDARMLDYLGC